MGDLIRGRDWAASPLGTMASWPVPLVATLNTILHTRQPMFLFWGPQYVCFYNDAYRPILGARKHPQALGQRGQELWYEIWPDIGVQLDGVMRNAQATWYEDRLLPFDRYGYTEEIYFTFGYSPVFIAEGRVGGVLASLTETTGQVIAQRRLTTLTAVSGLKLEGGGYAAVAQAVAAELSRNARDVPFFICYDVRDRERPTRLAACGRIPDDGSNQAAGNWPIAAALDTGAPVAMHDLARRFPARTLEEDEPLPDTAVVIPVSEPSADVSGAVIVVGVNPYKALDGDYRQFLDLLGTQIGAAFSAATAFDTERQRVAALQSREAELRALLNNIVAMVAILSPGGVVTEINELPLRLSGVQRADVIGKSFSESYWWSYDSDASQRLREACARAARGEGSRFDTTVRVTDDRLMSIDFMLAPLVDGEGNVTQLVASAFDITERTRTMRELAEAERVAAGANRAKSEFLANISHEIRSPLSAILGYAEILFGELRDDEARQYAATIQDSGTHLLGLVNDILDLSRIEAGRLDIEPEAFALPPLLDALYAAFVPAADDKGLGLVIRSITELPARVVSDARRIRQVLVNLLSNAVKFTAAGEVGVDVDYRADDSGSRLVFTVHDTGPGIAEAERADLFQAFSQLDGSNARLHGGAGLGLAISRQLATLLAGDLRLESTPGIGSRFIFEVPVTTQAGGAVIASQTTFDAFEDRRVAAVPQRRIEGRILAVDDRRDMRFLVASYLESVGASVVTAASAKEAFTHIADGDRLGEPFAGVILDIQMPGMDGYTVARRLRAAGFPAPIIALTAAAMKGDRERCLAAGCDAYLTKPVSRARLVDILARALDFYAASKRPHNPAAPETGNTLKVLIVEDDEASAAALTKLLRLKGFEVATAGTGEAALRLAGELSPVVAVIDWRLPDASGAEVAERLRAASATPLTCIALSGYPRNSIESPPGIFDHYLQKPADIGKLTALIREAGSSGAPAGSAGQA